MLSIFDTRYLDRGVDRAGLVYVIDGTNELVLYLGRNRYDEVVLYHLGVLDVLDGVVVNPDIQLPYICSICNNTMDIGFDKNLMRLEKDVKVYGILTGVNYVDNNYFAIWFAKGSLCLKDCPVLLL